MLQTRVRESLGHIGQALRQPEDFAFAWHHQNANYSWSVFAALGGTAVLGTTTYGLVMGMPHGAREMVIDAQRFSLGAGIAWSLPLPALYILNSLSGSRLKPSTTLLAALVTTSWGGLAMMAAIPIAWFFTLAIPHPAMVLAVHLAVFSIVGVAMIDVFSRVMARLEPRRGPSPCLVAALGGRSGERTLLCFGAHRSQFLVPRMRSRLAKSEIRKSKSESRKGIVMLTDTLAAAASPIADSSVSIDVVDPPEVLPVDEAPEIKAGSSILGLVEILLKFPAQADKLNRDEALQAHLIPRFLAIALGSYTLFGVAMLIILNAVAGRGVSQATAACAGRELARWFRLGICGCLSHWAGGCVLHLLAELLFLRTACRRAHDDAANCRRSGARHGHQCSGAGRHPAHLCGRHIGSGYLSWPD